MSIQPDSPHRPRTLAVLALLVAQALILGFVLFTLLESTSGLSRFLHLAGKTNGLVLLALLVLQTGVSTALGVVNLWRRVPAFLHFVVPLTILGVGSLSRLLGVQAAIEATFAADPIKQPGTWLHGFAGADLNHAAALLMIGAGGLAALASVAIPAFHRRSRGTPYTHAGVMIGLGGLTASICVGLGLLAGPGAGVFAPSWFVAVPAFLGLFLAGIAAPGIASAAKRRSDSNFAALVAGLGLVGGLLAFTRGLSHLITLNTLQAASYRAPSSSLSRLLRIADHIDTLGIVSVVVGLAAAVSLLVVARAGAPRWTRPRKTELALVGLLLVSGLTSLHLGGSYAHRQNRSLTEDLPSFGIGEKEFSPVDQRLSARALARALAERNRWPPSDE